ncbi:MAG: hypothetical protein U0836_06165 [Pirellulales bacterium]
MNAAPSRFDLEKSSEPVLVQAKKSDFAFVGPRKAQQAAAEKHYLAFAVHRPTDSLTPYIYFHLAHSYQDWVLPTWQEKYGHRRDDAKARQFFGMAISLHPPGKISGLLMDARVSHAALAPSDKEKVAEYLECYRWLNSLTRDQFKDKQWLSEAEGTIAATSPAFLEASTASLVATRLQLLQVIRTNVVALAGDSLLEPIVLLDDIENVGEPLLAAQARDMRTQVLQRNPALSPVAWSVRTWRAGAVAAGLVAPAVVGWTIQALSKTSKKRKLALGKARHLPRNTQFHGLRASWKLPKVRVFDRADDSPLETPQRSARTACT